ncbi:hypothetical protein ACQPZG_03420 (plasmid) [Streptomyces sp. CA-294286]|uniref:hypothetical protein n=1 Tax=Streptomyces sp. CA-294286 TaxID=3240070 RepID=UPI003D8FF365
MSRPSHQHSAVAVLTLGLLTLTACGTMPTGAGTDPPPPTALASPTAPGRTASERAAKTAHDRKFPDVAARCKSGDGAAPTAAPDRPEPVPSDSEAAKYAENHAFKQQTRLTPEARCRGEAHARRIEKALTGPDAAAFVQEAELVTALTRLGYESDDGSVHRTGHTLGFSYLVPGIGPCVTGQLGPRATFEAHGAYLEGGCTEPRGGH